MVKKYSTPGFGRMLERLNINVLDSPGSRSNVPNRPEETFTLSPLITHVNVKPLRSIKSYLLVTLTRPRFKLSA